MSQPATADTPQPIDTITILECTEERVATKRIRLGPGERGTVTDGYDAGTWFAPSERPINSFDDMATVLGEVCRNPRAFVIRGDLQERWRQSETVRRTSQPKPGIGASFVARPRRWLAIDIDKAPQPAGCDPAEDPEGAIEYLIGRLPPEFQDASCWWQWTSGQGFKGETLNARLWFWLSKPAADMALRRWAEKDGQIDPALYSAVEPHYLAAPILGPGVHDPLPRRYGVRRGLEDEVALELPDVATGGSQAGGWLGGGGSMGWTGRAHNESDVTLEEVANFLAVIPNSDLHYGDWLDIGTKVKAAVGDVGEDAFVVWSATSRKFDEDTARRKFRSLSGDRTSPLAIYHKACDHGFSYCAEMDLDAFMANVQARTANGNRPALVCPEPAEDEDWTMPDPIQGEGWQEPAEAAPDALPEPIGMVRIIRDHIIETSKYPQPELALVAALTIVGTAAARRYSFDVNVRTNTYFLGVAPSASGKNAPLEAVGRILGDAGFGEALAGGEPASGSAVSSRLLSGGTGRHAGVAIYTIDEFGMLLRAMTGERSPPHLREIVKALTIIYTKSAGEYSGKDFADRKDRPTQKVQQPHLALFAVTAGTHIWKGITPDAIADGSVARFMVIEAANPFPAYNRGARPPVTPQTVKDALKRIHDCGGHPGAGNLAGATPEAPPSLREMSATPAAARMFDEAVDWEIELKRRHHAAGLSAVYGRLVEQSKKLAMIHSLGRDVERATIDEVDARFGLDLALTLIERFVVAIGKNVARNDQERDSNAVLAMIKDAGRKGLAQNEITRRTQYLKMRERTELLGSLEEAGMVKQKPDKTGGRARTVWFYVKPS